MKRSDYYKKLADEANMNDDSDMKVFGLLGKAHKAKKQENFEEKELPILQKDYDVDMFQVNSYRIKTKDGKKTVDFYPPSGKLFNHQTKKWDKTTQNNRLTKIKRALL